MVICRGTSKDIGAIARVHVQSFSGFYLTDLGDGFLREYYRTVLLYPGGIMLVARVEEQTSGFAVGFMNPPGFYRCLRSRRLRLAISALPALLRRPALLPGLVGRARAVTQSGAGRAPPGECELASIAVAPGLQGKGIGAQLIRTFVSQARALGGDRVSLSTDAEDNDAANCFYHSLGFQIRKTYSAPGRRVMHRYEMNLGQAGGEEAA